MVHGGSAGTRAPTSVRPDTLTPPAGFDGGFHTSHETRHSYAGASGPYRIEPTAVARPADAEAVCELVRWAEDEGVALVPRGAGTGMPAGNVGRGVCVDLTELDGIGSVDPEQRTIQVGAGAVAGAVDRIARKTGLFLPALPSSADRCTIGGMVANNAAGSRSFGYGSIRDWILSLDVILADGRSVSVVRGPEVDGGDGGRAPTLAPALEELPRRLAPAREALADGWPRVRKNSSGYALDRYFGSGDDVDLFVGSEGTLGIVTGATLRLEPVPDAVAVAFLGVSDAAGLSAAVRRADELGASACEFFGSRLLEIARLEDDPRVGHVAEGAYALVMFELDGAVEDVAESVEGARRLATDLGSDLVVAEDPVERAELWAVRHASSPMIARAAADGRVSMQFIEDSVVPPARLPDYLEGLETILGGHDTDAIVFGHAGDANVHVNPLVDVTRSDWKGRVRSILERTVDLVADLGGTLTGEHGDGRVRAPFLDRIYSREAMTAFRTVKRAMDPRGLLNPGVILPLDDQDPLEGITDPRG